MLFFLSQLTYKQPLRFLAGLFLVAATSSSCVADLIFQPPGLSAGDQYNLIFTTSGIRDALSEEIDDYNDFVQSVADAAPVLGQWGLEWKALVWLPPNVTAMDNTNTPREFEDIPIYRVDGERLVNNHEGLWGPNAVSTQIGLDINEFGNVMIGDPLKYENGEIQVHVGGFLNANGRRTNGIANGGRSQLISGGSLRALNDAHFYAVSEVITVVPEPSSGMLGLFAIVTIAPFRRHTR